MIRHANGERVLRAYCELNDEPSIIPDVIQRVDADFHPQDASVRLTEADRFKGTTSYRFTDNDIEYQGFTSKKGRISGKDKIDRSIRGFVNHSLMGDAWLVARFNRSHGRGQHVFRYNPQSSLVKNDSKRP